MTTLHAGQQPTRLHNAFERIVRLNHRGDQPRSHRTGEDYRKDFPISTTPGNGGSRTRFTCTVDDGDSRYGCVIVAMAVSLTGMDDQAVSAASLEEIDYVPFQLDGHSVIPWRSIQEAMHSNE